MAIPGEVFYLPPHADEPTGKGKRPHVLLNRCTPSTELATLGYGSTQPTDAAFGAEHVYVGSHDVAHRGSGLIRPTYVYTSRLVSALPERLRHPAGSLRIALPAIRASLVRALGLGMGVTRESNVRGANRRGRVVALAEHAATEWGTNHALVVTNPEYSRYGYRQTLVPLLSGRFETFEPDVVLHDSAWLGPLSDLYSEAILAVPSVATVYLPRDIDAFLDLVSPAQIMDQVDRALVAYLELEGFI
ncbi:MAG TPA: hypothetical protein VFJ82_21350 [Longimicrobium sp.]|nr:hypothetical protein [Longimicrobium sp.]